MNSMSTVFSFQLVIPVSSMSPAGTGLEITIFRVNESVPLFISYQVAFSRRQ